MYTNFTFVTYFLATFRTKNKELAILENTLTKTKGKFIEFFEAFERSGVKGQDGFLLNW